MKLAQWEVSTGPCAGLSRGSDLTPALFILPGLPL